MIPAADALEAGRGLKRTEEEMADAIASVERVLCRTGTSMIGWYGLTVCLLWWVRDFLIFAGIYCVMSTSLLTSRAGLRHSCWTALLDFHTWGYLCDPYNVAERAQIIQELSVVIDSLAPL